MAKNLRICFEKNSAFYTQAVDETLRGKLNRYAKMNASNGRSLVPFNQRGDFNGNRTINTWNQNLAEVISFMVVYLLIAIVAIVGNASTVIAFKINRRLRSVTFIYFASLAFSDFLVGAFSIPLWMYSFFCSQSDACTPNTNIIYYFYVPFDVFSAVASIAHLTSISIERMAAISKFFNHRQYTRRSHLRMVIFNWIYALTISIVYVLLSRINETKIERTLLVFIAAFALPVLLIVAMYCKIYARVKSMHKKLEMELYSGKTKKQQVWIQTTLQRERKTAVTGAIVTLLFIFAWLPFFITSMMFTFCKGCLTLDARRFSLLFHFVKMMHYSNSMVNPLIYSLRNKNMRKTLLRLVLPCVGVNNDSYHHAQVVMKYR